MENTKPNKKLYIVVEVILFAVYILIGVLLFVTEKHCAADAFIFWIGLVIAAVCAVVLGIHEKDVRSKKEEVILRKPNGCDGCLVFLR